MPNQIAVFLAALLMCSTTINASHAREPATKELKELINQLKRFGFKVKYEHPPIRTAYGLFISKTKTLFISPLAFELGIGTQVLLHEATHAAQSCPNGKMSLIGWKIKTSEHIHNEISGILFNAYKHASKSLEEEAFLIQGHPNGTSMIKEALAQRCAKNK